MQVYGASINASASATQQIGMWKTRITVLSRKRNQVSHSKPKTEHLPQ